MELALIVSVVKWIIGGGFLLFLVILIRRYYKLKSLNKKKDEIIFGHELKDEAWDEIVKLNKKKKEEEERIKNADKEGVLDMLNRKPE